MPEGRPLNRARFTTEICNLIDEGDTLWSCEDRNRKIWAANKMDGPQPLSLEYDLKEWMNNQSKSTDPNVRSQINPNKVRTNYRGIEKIKN